MPCSSMSKPHRGRQKQAVMFTDKHTQGEPITQRKKTPCIKNYGAQDTFDKRKEHEVSQRPNAKGDRLRQNVKGTIKCRETKKRMQRGKREREKQRVTDKESRRGAYSLPLVRSRVSVDICAYVRFGQSILPLPHLLAITTNLGQHQRHPACGQRCCLTSRCLPRYTTLWKTRAPDASVSWNASHPSPSHSKNGRRCRHWQ